LLYVYYSISIVVLAEDERGAVRPESPWSHPRRSICFPPGVRRPCARSMQQSLATDGSRSVVLGDAVGTRERKSHCTPTHLALDEGIHHAHARSHVGSTVAAAPTHAGVQMRAVHLVHEPTEFTGPRACGPQTQ
jgi:hypothetical protein